MEGRFFLSKNGPSKNLFENTHLIVHRKGEGSLFVLAFGLLLSSVLTRFIPLNLKP